MSDASLEQQFHEAMLGIYDAGRRLRPPFNSLPFLQMVNQHGGKETADRLLAKSSPSNGFTELFVRGPGNLRISVEYLVLESPWRMLFDEKQLDVARRRLTEVGCPLPPEDESPTPLTVEVPVAVRILPMSAGLEFPGQTTESVQKRFFLDELPSRSPAGEYQYRAKGLQTPLGTAVLFQFKNAVIASAVLKQVEKYEQPQGPYHGTIHFDPDSIRVFDPVGPEEMKEAWPNFPGFGNAPLSLDADRYPAFQSLLTGVKRPSPVVKLPEEVITDTLVEGAVRRITVNAYERNPEARKLCIEHYGAVCAICQFDFGVTYGPIADGFVHVHHLIPLSEIGTEYEVDPIHDLIPVCPNCHAVIHMGGQCLRIEQVRDMLTSSRSL
ncbi:MAG: HNH endonuclease [Planctomycetaceae bacterium]